MAKTVLFNVKVDDELKEAFTAAAEANDRNASQVIRDLMRGYIAERDVSPDYQEYLQQKVERAREQKHQGHFRTSAEVEADFAQRRDGWA